MIAKYLDAGSGSAFLAILSGGIAGIWLYVKSLFVRKKKDSQDDLGPSQTS